jgi:hypothetical protein
MPLRITLEPWDYESLSTIGPFFSVVKSMKFIDDGKLRYDQEEHCWPQGVYDLTAIQEIEFYGRGNYSSTTQKFLSRFWDELSTDIVVSLDFPSLTLAPLLSQALIRYTKTLNLNFGELFYPPSYRPHSRVF